MNKFIIKIHLHHKKMSEHHKKMSEHDPTWFKLGARSVLLV